LFWLPDAGFAQRLEKIFYSVDIVLQKGKREGERGGERGRERNVEREGEREWEGEREGKREGERRKERERVKFTVEAAFLQIFRLKYSFAYKLLSLNSLQWVCLYPKVIQIKQLLRARAMV
jgi:hypothetical protein